MKKVLVSLFIPLLAVVAFAEDFEILEHFELQDFECCTIATKNIQTAIQVSEEWGIQDPMDSETWITIDQIEELLGDSLSDAGYNSFSEIMNQFEAELGNRIGLFLYYYQEVDLKVSAIWWHDNLVVKTDSEEMNKVLPEAMQQMLYGFFKI